MRKLKLREVIFTKTAYLTGGRNSMLTQVCLTPSAYELDLSIVLSWKPSLVWTRIGFRRLYKSISYPPLQPPPPDWVQGPSSVVFGHSTHHKTIVFRGASWPQGLLFTVSPYGEQHNVWNTVSAKKCLWSWRVIDLWENGGHFENYIYSTFWLDPWIPSCKDWKVWEIRYQGCFSTSQRQPWGLDILSSWVKYWSSTLLSCQEHWV